MASVTETLLWQRLDEVLADKNAKEAEVATLQAELQAFVGTRDESMPLREQIRAAKAPLFEICREHSMLAMALNGKKRPE